MKIFVILRLALLASFIGAALPLSAAGITYTYYTNDRLWTVKYDDGTVIEYTYDGAGNRQTKVVTPGSQSFSNEAPPPREISGTSPSPFPAALPTSPLPGTASPPGSFPLANLPSGNWASGPLVREVLPSPPASGEEMAPGLLPDSAPALPEPPPAQVASLPEALATPPGQPATPYNLGVVATQGEVTLFWHVVGVQPAGFIIQRRDGPEGKEFVEIARLSYLAAQKGSLYRWIDKDVRSGQSYVYRVKAFSDQGASPFSPSLEVELK